MTPDSINSFFGFAGSAVVWCNVLRTYRDKQIKGVHPGSVAFFFAWGIWNLFYFPYLGQWVSFAGACSIVLANGVWVAQILYYLRRAS